MPGQQSRSLRVIGAAVGAAVLAGGAVVLEFHQPGPPPMTGPTPILAGILGVVLVIAELRPPSWLTFGDQNVSLSWVVSVSMVLCGATAGALLLTGLAVLIHGVCTRERFSSTLFNGAQVMISLSCGVWVLRATGALGQLLPGRASVGVRWDLAVVLAGVAVYVANATLVAGACRVVRGARFVPTLVEGLRVNVAGDGVLMALAPVVVVVGQRGLALLPFVALTAIGVYGVARLAMRHGHAATHDPLTGLANRRGFEEQARELLERGGAAGVAVLVIDLDHFKPVNDQFGHATGDAVLVEVARRLRLSMPPGTIAARLGGDEFAAAFCTSSSAETRRVGDRILDGFVEPMAVGGQRLQIGASVGAAVGRQGLHALLVNADTAMYRAKSLGLGLCVTDVDSHPTPSGVRERVLATDGRAS